jgi:CheY-like chemotaxis protein
MVCTILLVEDNPADILLMQRIFQEEPFVNVALQIVRDGNTAILYLNGNGEYSDRTRYPLPNLMLLDQNLPQRSGYEVLAWLKQQPYLKRLPVIMLTTSHLNVDINQAYEFGANAYLVKPTGFETLRAIMNSLNDFWFKYNYFPDVSAPV